MVNNKSNGTATRNNGFFLLVCLWLYFIGFFLILFFPFRRRVLVRKWQLRSTSRPVSLFGSLCFCCLISSGSKYGHLLNNSSILKEWCNKQTTTNIWIIEEWPINNRWRGKCGALVPLNRIFSVASGSPLYLFICSFIYLHHSARMHLPLKEDQIAANVKFWNSYRTDSILNLKFFTSLEYTCLLTFYL